MFPQLITSRATWPNLLPNIKVPGAHFASFDPLIINIAQRPRCAANTAPCR